MDTVNIIIAILTLYGGAIGYSFKILYDNLKAIRSSVSNVSFEIVEIKAKVDDIKDIKTKLINVEKDIDNIKQRLVKVETNVNWIEKQRKMFEEEDKPWKRHL